MKTIHVAAAVIEKDNKILIAKRLKGTHKELWKFPGGKIEHGESPEQALKREIKEELDADIQIKNHLTTVHHDYPDFHLKMEVYTCTLISSSMHLNDHSDIRWIDPEEENIEWVPADIQVIKQYKRLIK